MTSDINRYIKDYHKLIKSIRNEAEKNGLLIGKTDIINSFKDAYHSSTIIKRNNEIDSSINDIDSFYYNEIFKTLGFNDPICDKLFNFNKSIDGNFNYSKKFDYLYNKVNGIIDNIRSLVKSPYTKHSEIITKLIDFRKTNISLNHDISNYLYDDNKRFELCMISNELINKLINFNMNSYELYTNFIKFYNNLKTFISKNNYEDFEDAKLEINNSIKSLHPDKFNDFLKIIDETGNKLSTIYKYINACCEVDNNFNSKNKQKRKLTSKEIENLQLCGFY